MKKQISKNSFKITPIGGVGEIGSNCVLVELENKSILIDAGMLFPYENFFDINYLTPDFNFLKDKNVTDIVFTHGHEDHIGAAVKLMDYLPKIVMHASAFTKELLTKKLEQSNKSAKINLFKEDSVLKFDELAIHPIHVNHSIPETFGLFLDNRLSNHQIFYCSDFKVDPLTQYEKPFDFEKIKRLRDNDGELTLMIDSTNILNPNKTISEFELLEDVEKIIQSDYERIYVTLFSSNIHRIQTFSTLAEKHNRPIFFSGRSLDRYTSIARELGILQVKASELSDVREALEIPNNALIFLTGCQGDFKGALRRVSVGEDKSLKLREKDVVVFSSKAIPGNEKVIYRLENAIIDQGASIITDKDMKIHASGHPGREDLKIVYDTLKPDRIIPIHGESLFIQRHCEFIAENYPGIQTIDTRNFNTLNFDFKGNVSTTPLEELPPLIIHGSHLEIPREKISERRKMATAGTVFVTITRKKKNVDIKLTLKGIPAQEKFLEMLEDNIDNQVRQMPQYQDDQVAEEIKNRIRREINSHMGYKPVTIVHIL